MDSISMMNNEAQLKQKIGQEEILHAAQILRKYKEGKARLEAKIIANEEFWKLRQWNYHNDEKDEFKPATAWLWKMIQGRYSDVMDSYPTCNFQPRQMDDKDEAKKLSSIVPIILAQNKYDETYSDIAWYMLKNGGCIQAVMWDSSKHNGMGDISIKKIDFLNFFSEPGVTDIQKSENIFTTELMSNRILQQRYPQTVGHLNGNDITLAKYKYDDRVDTNDKSIVVDWYYKTEYNGRKAVHYVKFVNDVVLYATENMTELPTRKVMNQYGAVVDMPIEGAEPMAVRGLYDHALYPFVVQDLYPIEGSICGYGLTDIGRDCQMQIDVINKAVTDNAVVTSKPRYFIKNDGSVNEEEFCNMEKTLIHVEGNLGEENIRPVDVPGLSSTCTQELQFKIEELKYITSNMDVNNGGTPSGITAASAIAALQETAGKDSRSTNQSFHRAFKEVCYMIVELIRQFYDVPRQFRIIPDSMGEQFTSFDNSGLKPQPQMLNGVQNGYRVPEFDIEVTTEKASPYKKIEQNELALNFYNLGFFNPQMADQAIACLEMMDFNKKDEIIQKIQQNGTMMQMLLQYQQIALSLAQQVNPQLAEQIGQQILMQGGQPMAMGDPNAVDLTNDEEHPFVEKARTEADNSTQI